MVSSRPTIVEGDPKAHFSIATTPRYRGGYTPFSGLLHLASMSMQTKQSMCFNKNTIWWLFEISG